MQCECRQMRVGCKRRGASEHAGAGVSGAEGSPGPQLCAPPPCLPPG